VVLAVIAFAALQNALLLTNFNQEATGIVIGALLLVSVFAPNAAALWRRGLPRWARGRPSRPAPSSSLGALHD
jgi:rhamnose transport system permease protein